MDEADEPSELGSPTSDLIDLISRRLAATVVVASAIIGLAIYARPGPPRYQAVATGSQVVRLNTKTGAMVACEGGRCAILIRQHEHLERGIKLQIGGTPDEAAKAPPAPPATQPPAAPAAPAAPKAQ